jgi:hypothetical protein
LPSIALSAWVARFGLWGFKSSRWQLPVLATSDIQREKC